MKATGNCWDIRAEKNTAEIDIFGTIGDLGMWDEGVSAADFVRELRGLGRLSRLNLNIHSVGGSVWDGLAMYRAIRDFQMAPKGEKVAHVASLSASIATVVMLGADRVEIAPEAQVMIHDPMGITFGGEKDHEDSLARLKQAKQQIVQIYQRRTGQPAEKLADLMAAETWMLGDEAKELGFADVVKADVPKSRVAAIATDFLGHFKNVPAGMVKREPAAVSPEVAARLKKLGVV